MKTHDVKHIVVVGAGQMGHQIAMLCALGGYTTILQDVNEEALQKAEASLNGRMNQWVEKKKLTDEEKKTAFANLTYTTNLEEAARNTDLVIEAIVEKVDAKRELFRKLDQLTPDHTILATNSSTIVNSLLAGATNRPEKVCNMHFFYPPLVMECVEVVKSEKTADETAEAAMAVCKQIGRTGILLQKEIAGFVANRILGAIHQEAIHLYEEGIADFKDIDCIVKKSLGHPLGPFELIDLSGADVVYNAMQHRFTESGNSEDKPPACIEEKVKAGDLGRKTGQGFYTYNKEKVTQ
ncbi:3-hydroxyacyl-CoA dehydrogenase family protein [Filibacter tadaridae]|uniref:Putative 3-hydroxybutyryl-CoA dehydrogenase n=1 Tax=Filibacter tadaridae TaxID=2483811 RepID=A0A3P5X1N4_9BACL|nr:3-hydroxyacyl-CoA dehydrogenase family protein [Filibacter tadaridae]VDC28234.1 putative 3-hydroxybutyryl-CoA dehydrogenase [Filibacter tadaridae]